MAGPVVDSDERMQDILSPFLRALHDAFTRYQTPSSNSNPAIPPPLLLPALQFFVQKVTEEVVPNAGKICLRPIKQEDLDMLAQTDPLFNIEQPIDFDKFQQIAMRTLKQVALGRVKRLGFFIIGGILVIHFMKSAAKRIPYIGPSISAFARILVPTPVLGPLVGVAGSIYLQDFSDRAFMRFVNLINQ